MLTQESYYLLQALIKSYVFHEKLRGNKGALKNWKKIIVHLCSTTANAVHSFARIYTCKSWAIAVEVKDSDTQVISFHQIIIKQYEKQWFLETTMKFKSNCLQLKYQCSNRSCQMTTSWALLVTSQTPT